MIAVGSSLGPYEVVGQLRSGGMANLFLGARSGPGGFRRHVVIKAIKAHLASHEDFVRMFLDEGRIAARIQHPNVVRIEELGRGAPTTSSWSTSTAWPSPSSWRAWPTVVDASPSPPR